MEVITQLLTAHPTLSIIAGVGTVVVAASNAGKAIDTLSMLARKVIKSNPPLHGTWQGFWQKPDGFAYSFVMQLDVDTSGNARGEILWRLLATPPRSFLEPRVGHEAIEYVGGSYSREHRYAELQGSAVSDPTLIAVDSYRFQILDDKVTFAAMTRTHAGTWDAAAQGRVILSPLAKH